MSAEKNVVPVITSVKDDKGEIPDGGATSATYVQLSGGAAAGEKVEIFDGAVLRGQVVVGAAGRWDFHLTGLKQGIHSITAKGSAGTSPVRSFIVSAAK
ncbi:hypothetical protein BK673_22870 [Pseudomonas fluorescens]|uniref:Uncharacterized protein n=1 Tax=Pseudomonas fluorescens TaxID=294 RepID=A0A423P1Z6_PSEFL|nr:hypothetical protein [Pseudomonas fluorescens]ROO05097.1 hypothetical protein BK673_22870 [Pseudomonas fluorescens]